MKKFRRKVLDMLMSNNSGSSLRQQLLDGAPFRSSLLYTAVPQRAASGTTATFTRATTSTWQNNDGYLVTGVAGEIGFVGARRVYNALQNASIPSQDFSVAAWAAGGVKSVTANYATAPDGTTTADRVVIAAGDYLRANTNLGSSSNSKTWLGSVYVKATSGTQTFRILLTQNGVANNYSSDLVATSEWQRFSFSIPFTSGGSGLLCGIADKAAGGGTDLVVWGYQVEDVTAQTTQTAGEYVSVGVESAPYYHGSFVDGVKCFPTDLSGNPIPSTTLLGYRAEGARTNLCLQSQTLQTATWALSAGANPISVNSSVAPDGTTTADLLYEKSDAVVKYVAQSITITTAAHTWSVYAKENGRRFLAIDAYDGSQHLSYFDLVNGTTGTNAAGNTSSIESVGDGWYRCSVTRTAAGTGGYIQLYLAEVDNSISYTGDGSSGIYLWGAQVELGAFASSYIPTTTIAVARNADVLTYSSAGNIDGTKGWCYAEVSPDAVSASNQVVIGTNGANRTPAYQIAPTGAFGAYDGTNAPTFAASAFTANTSAKVSSSWGSAGLQGAVGGVVSAVTSFDGNYDFTDISVGVNNSSTNAYFGTIRNVRIGQRQLSSSELQAVTR